MVFVSDCFGEGFILLGKGRRQKEKGRRGGGVFVGFLCPCQCSVL